MLNGSSAHLVLSLMLRRRRAGVPQPAPPPMTSHYSPTLPCMIPPSAKIVVAVR